LSSEIVPLLVVFDVLLPAFDPSTMKTASWLTTACCTPLPITVTLLASPSLTAASAGGSCDGGGPPYWVTLVVLVTVCTTIRDCSAHSAGFPGPTRKCKVWLNAQGFCLHNVHNQQKYVVHGSSVSIMSFIWCHKNTFLLWLLYSMEQKCPIVC